MNINFKNTESETTFEDIEIGEIFLSMLTRTEYAFYIKTEDICTLDGEIYNAIDISDGSLIGFDDWEIVSEVEYELNVCKKERKCQN